MVAKLKPIRTKPIKTQLKRIRTSDQIETHKNDCALGGGGTPPGQNANICFRGWVTFPVIKPKHTFREKGPPPRWFAGGIPKPMTNGRQRFAIDQLQPEPCASQSETRNWNTCEPVTHGGQYVATAQQSEPWTSQSDIQKPYGKKWKHARANNQVLFYAGARHVLGPCFFLVLRCAKCHRR